MTDIKELALSDEEITLAWDKHTVPVFGKTGINPVVFARAIEQAVHAKYTARDAEAVPVVQVTSLRGNNIMKTLTQLPNGTHLLFAHPAPAADAHALWSAAQLVPGEGIEDGVARIQALLCNPVVHIGMTVLDISDDDALRYIQRVLESEAPKQDRNAAHDLVVEIRTRVRKHADDVSRIEALLKQAPKEES